MRFFAAILLLGGCRNGEAPPAVAAPAAPTPAQAAQAATPAQPAGRDRDRLRWSMSSAGATVVQELEGDAACSLRCSSSGGGWQVRLCAAERADVRIVSADCAWLAVLRRDPEIEDSISATPVGALFHRGLPARLVTAGELPAGAVSVSLNRLQWLGEGPAQLRGEALALPLRAGPDAVVPLAAAAERKAAEAAAQIRYLDDQGTLHLVDSRDEVPGRYRGRAMEVTSSAVTVLHMPPPVPDPEPPAPESPGPPPKSASLPPARTPRPARRGPAPYGLTYLEWLRVLSGQRGLGDPDRPACIGNDGKPKQCNE
jgi:hypothetical protein